MFIIMIDLSNLSDIEVYELWNNGITYWQAKHQLTPDETKNRKKVVEILKQEHSQKVLEENRHPKKETTNLDLMKTLTSMMTNPHDKELNQIERDLFNMVIRSMNSDRLIALGFERPRTLNSRPVLVPVDVLAYKIPKYSSDGLTLRKGRIKIDDVKFVWRRYIDQVLNKTKSIEAPKPTIENPVVRKKSGRPSTKETIEKAYKQCNENGEIDFTLFKKDAAYIVRSYIQNNLPEDFGTGKGFSIQTVIKYISKEFDRNQLKYNKI